MKFLKNNFILFLIIILALSIRLYRINSLTLFGDEIDVAYQAYSILNTGHDYKGNLLPIYIQSLSESRAPLLIYTSIPFVKIFGLNEFGVRFSSVFFGIISIILFYKLIILLTSNKKLALISSLIMAITPWHIFYSRASFEVTLLLSLILGGILSFYKFINNKKNILAIFSIICFCLCFYTYNTANIFIPLICIYLFVSNFKKIKSILSIKSFIVYFIIFISLIIPISYQILFGSAAKRFNLISIFNNPKTIDSIVFKRTGFSSSQKPEERYFHNKLNYWAKDLIYNYSNSFSPNFLFVSGDPNPRHTTPGFGLFLFSCLPLFFIGIFSLDKKAIFDKLMIYWLLIAPISSSLTINGSSHATRLFILMPPIIYIISLGIINLIKGKKQIIFIPAISLFLVINLISYLHEYYVHYPKESFENWNYGYKDLMEHIPPTTNKTFISNSYYNSLLPYLYYQKYDPNLLMKYHLNDQNQPNIYKNISGFKLNDSIYFLNGLNEKSYEQFYIVSNQNDVFVLFQLKDIPGDLDFSKNPLNGYKSIHTTYNPNGTIFGQIIQKL